jgi:hypothetical protein
VNTDAVHVIVAIDTSAYFNLRSAMMDMIQLYAVSIDMLEKNKAKIQDPRGDSEHGMSMF